MNKNNDLLEKDSIRENFLRAMNKFNINSKTLAKITGLNNDYLISYLNKNINLVDSTSLEMNLFLSNISFMLSEGIMLIDDDERVAGIIDVLVSEFNINYETLSLYSNLQLEDIQNFMNDPNSISIDKKYKLAVKSIFLHYLLKK